MSLVEFAVDTVYTDGLPNVLARRDRDRGRPMSLRVWVGLRCPLADQLVAKILGRRWHGCGPMREIAIPDDIPCYSLTGRDTSKKVGDIADALVAFSEAQARAFAKEMSSLETLCSAVRREIEDTASVASAAPPKPAPILIANGADRHISLIGLLVYSGREDVGRKELGILVRSESKGRISRDRHYFIERMTRLLDDGAVSGTLLRWDVRPLGLEPCALDTLSEAGERRNAFEAVCRKAKGMSEEDIRATLEEVEIGRGFSKEPLAVECYVARAMQGERVSVTRLRSIVRGMRLTIGS